MDSDLGGKPRLLVTEDNYRDVEDKFGIKVDHLIRLKNKADLENTILKKEVHRLQEANTVLQRGQIMEDLEIPSQEEAAVVKRQVTEEEIS
jgi:hypothetical protein